MPFSYQLDGDFLSARCRCETDQRMYGGILLAIVRKSATDNGSIWNLAHNAAGVFAPDAASDPKRTRLPPSCRIRVAMSASCGGGASEPTTAATSNHSRLVRGSPLLIA